MVSNWLKITTSLIVLFVLASCNAKTEQVNETINVNDVEKNQTVADVETTQTVVNSNTFIETKEISSENIDYPDWTDDTHSKDWEADYDTVFPQDSVNTIEIVISPEEWEKMNEDMEWIYGEFWTRSGWGGWADDSITEKPTHIETQVYMNGTQWYNVWFKLKWHSSLQSAWSSWNYKLPFKLDFDEFEDDYEELNNQRFYGFKKLSFSSNYLDDSLMHEKLASETFEEAWLVVAKTAFYSVYVDYGEGSKYFGVYTAVENIDDTVIDKFGDDSGNVYEAEGDGTKLNPDTATQISTHFEKKTNEEEADWSDIENLSDILNSDLRTTDTATWKANLEEVFDVDVFLTWLSVNSTIQNWDTYWVMTHNFYLYNNPETGKLTWIPWDNNEAFLPWKRGLVTLTANSVGDDWPLIRYILDDEDYRATYVEKVNNFSENILGTDEYTQRVEELHEMLTPYVVWENGEESYATHLRNDAAFTSSLNTLLSFLEARVEASESLSITDDFEYSATAAQNVRWGWGWWRVRWEWEELWDRPVRWEGEEFWWERPARPEWELWGAWFWERPVR